MGFYDLTWEAGTLGSCFVWENVFWVQKTVLQPARHPCPLATPRAYSNSSPSCQWCHPTISSSVIPSSSCPQSFPASRSFPMSWLLASGGRSIGTSASASVLPVSIQNWIPLGWTGLISLQSKGLSRVFSNATVQKHQFFGAQLSLSSKSHICTVMHPTTGKTMALTRWTFVSKLMSLPFSMLSRLVIAFLLRRKCLLISWLQSLLAVTIWSPKKIKSSHCFHFFPIYLPWSDGTRCHDITLLNVEF